MFCAADYSRSQLRKALRETRRALPARAQRLAARNLYRNLVGNSRFLRARRVALYLANDGEIDPYLVRRHLHARKRQVYLPVLARWPRQRMCLQRVSPSERLRPNRFGIDEPVFRRDRQLPVWALDMILLPLVGFDEYGGRLGMGGGFYDRALAYRKRRRSWPGPRLLGLAHDCQQVDELALACWDVPLAATVTDSKWISAGAGGGASA